MSPETPVFAGNFLWTADSDTDQKRSRKQGGTNTEVLKEKKEDPIERLAPGRHEGSTFKYLPDEVKSYVPPDGEIFYSADEGGDISIRLRDGILSSHWRSFVITPHGPRISIVMVKVGKDAFAQWEEELSWRRFGLRIASPDAVSIYKKGAPGD